MANMSISQALGFILGPVLALAFVPLGDNGIHIRAVKLELNVYTAPGFLGAVLALLNIVLVVLYFKDYNINFDTGDVGSRASSIQHSDSIVPDKRAVIGCIGLFFVVFLVFTVFETITTPLSMDEYAWTSVQATLYTGILFGVAAIISVVVFMIAKPLSRKIDERKLLFVGFAFMLCGCVILMPWSTESPAVEAAHIDPIGNNTNKHSYPITSMTVLPDSAASKRGCPLKYRWCVNSSKVLIEQFYVGAAMISIGYPISNLMTYSLYSKVLGSRPQGTMMGWLTAAGSLARTLGPLLVSTVYHQFGPRWTFLTSSIFVVLGFFILFGLYSRIVPLQNVY